VRIIVRGSLPSVTVELRVLDATGRVRWSRSQNRSALAAATYDFSFPVSTRAQGLSAGVYTLQASVQAGGAAAVERSRRLFVVDPALAKVPVSVIVRVAGTPAMAPGGAASPDQEGDLRTAQDAQELARLAIVRPDLHLTAAVPPFLLDEWGTQTAGGPTDSAEQTSAVGGDALDTLLDAVAAGMPMLRAGYGEPDLSDLATSAVDIARQIDAGDAVRAAFVRPDANTTASVLATGFGVASGLVPEAAAAVLATHGVSFLVADPGSLSRSHAATGGPVPFRVSVPTASGRSTTVTVLVLDRPDAALLVDPAGGDALAANLYARAASKQNRLPVVIEVSVGSEGARTVDIEAALDALARMPWVQLVDAPSAASMSAAGTATLRPRPTDPTPPPAALRDTVARASRLVEAYGAALASPVETATADAVMLAESRVWAGADGTWELADRGSAFAAAADAAASGVLSKITVEAPSVTLPGSEGRIPVSVVNGSNRTLHVVLQARSTEMRVRNQRISARLEPGENILSVPVALGTSASAKLDLTVTAGGLALASATATVSASYQDRIVLLAAAILVLLVLLFVIRRRIVRGGRATASSRRTHV
jgi:hypothetical protein